jgi:hypothetical protein
VSDFPAPGCRAQTRKPGRARPSRVDLPSLHTIGRLPDNIALERAHQYIHCITRLDRITFIQRAPRLFINLLQNICLWSRRNVSPHDPNSTHGSWSARSLNKAQSPASYSYEK